MRAPFGLSSAVSSCRTKLRVEDEPNNEWIIQLMERDSSPVGHESVEW